MARYVTEAWVLPRLYKMLRNIPPYATQIVMIAYFLNLLPFFGLLLSDELFSCDESAVKLMLTAEFFSPEKIIQFINVDYE